MKCLGILVGVLTPACFYVDLVTIVLGCSDLLVFPGEINNSLSLALDGDCEHTCIVVNDQMNYEWTLDMGTDYFIHHVIVYLGAQENTSQVPLLLDVGTECCDMISFSKDCYITYQPTGSNNSLSYNCESPDMSHARYLRLVRQTASPVELCEVQIFGCRSLAKGETNEALFKPTTQIATARDGPPSKAVDNNTDGNYGHGSCSHTTEVSGAQFWWQVDLTLALPVTKLTIYNRVDCCAFRLKNIEVLVGRSSTSAGESDITYTSCAQHDDQFPRVQTLVCAQPLCGRYVRVVKGPANVVEALTLCEVQVYAGTLDPGQPKTNELSVQTSSTSPTSPENMTRPENSEVNSAASPQNIRETTLDESSEVNSLSPLVVETVSDITSSGVAWADTGGETNSAPFPSTLHSIPPVKNPQPSVNDSTTQPSAENSATTETSDQVSLTGRDTAAETTTLTSHSDNDRQTITSGVEFTEVTSNTATSTFVSVTVTSGETVMPAPMSVTDVTPLEFVKVTVTSGETVMPAPMSVTDVTPLEFVKVTVTSGETVMPAPMSVTDVTPLEFVNVTVTSSDTVMPAPMSVTDVTPLEFVNVTVRSSDTAMPAPMSVTDVTPLEFVSVTVTSSDTVMPAPMSVTDVTPLEFVNVTVTSGETVMPAPISVMDVTPLEFVNVTVRSSDTAMPAPMSVTDVTPLEFVNVTVRSSDTAMPAPMSVTDVSPPESPPDGTKTMADLVFAVSFAEFADQATAAATTATARFYSTPTTTVNEGSLPNIEISAATSDVTVSVAVVVTDQQRSVSANLTSTWKLPSDMPVTDLDTLTAPRCDVLVTCHEGISSLETATRESELIITSRDHFITAPITGTSTLTSLDYSLTKSLSNMELVTSDTMLTVNQMTQSGHFVTDPVITNNIPVISREHFVTDSVLNLESVTTNSVLNANRVTNLKPVKTESMLPSVSPVTFYELFQIDSIINAIPISKMYSESLPMAAELTNLGLVTNHDTMATTAAHGNKETRDTSQSTLELLAVVATSISSSPTTVQVLLSPVAALTGEFVSTPSDFLVPVVVLSSDAHLTHLDSPAQELRQTQPFSSNFTSPYISEATNSGGDAIVDIIVSTVQEEISVVSSNNEYSHPASASLVDFSQITSTAVLPSSAQAEETNVDSSIDLLSKQPSAAPPSFIFTIEGQSQSLYVTSSALADATKVTVSGPGENAIRDMASSKDVLRSITPTASQVIDSNLSGSDDAELSYLSCDMSTDLFPLATSHGFSAMHSMTRTPGVSSVSVTRSKEDDMTLFVSDSSFAVSQTAHVTGTVGSMFLLPLPSASQVPRQWSSSEEDSQSLSNLLLSSEDDSQLSLSNLLSSSEESSHLSLSNLLSSSEEDSQLPLSNLLSSSEEDSQLSLSKQLSSSEEDSQLSLSNQLSSSEEDSQLSLSNLLSSSEEDSQLSLSNLLSSSEEDSQLSLSNLLSSSEEDSQLSLSNLLSSSEEDSQLSLSNQLSSSEEDSQLSSSNQTVLLETVTKFIPVLVDSDEPWAGSTEANIMPTTSTQSSGGADNHGLLSTSTVVAASEHVTTADVSATDGILATHRDSSLGLRTHFPLLHPAPMTSVDPSHDPESAQGLRQTQPLDHASLSTRSNKIESSSSKEQQVTAGSITWTSTPSTTTRPSPTPPRPKLCPCACQRKSLKISTSEGADYQEQLRQAIEDDLKVPRADLAQQVMKKTSAPDRRTSAAVFGAVAVATMVLTSLVLVLPDFIALFRWLHMCVVRRRRVVKRHLPA